MAAEGGHIDFVFLAPPLARPLDPLLCNTARDWFSDNLPAALLFSELLIRSNLVLKKSNRSLTFEMIISETCFCAFVNY